MRLGNTGKWFYFNPENKEDGGLKLKIPIMTKDEEFDWAGVIIAWTNIEDDDGNQISYTAENVRNLMETSPVFIYFVNHFFSQLNKEFLEYRERLEKN